MSEVPLTHKQFGEIDVKYSFGEGKVGEHDALFVVTENEDGGQMLIRFRPTDGMQIWLDDIQPR